MTHAWRLLALVAIVSCLAVRGSDESGSRVFLLHDPYSQGKQIVLEVTWTGNEENGALMCELFGEESQADEILERSEEYAIQQPTKEELREILDECGLFQSRKRRAAVEYEEKIREEIESSKSEPQEASGLNIPVIFPGTKWCGAGDIAKNYDDLGFHQDTDRCCREHDNCEDLLLSGETRNGLTNKSPFTKLSCKCDREIYDCLSRVNTFTSNTVGNSYFNLLKRECYELDYPFTKKCKKYMTLLKLKCLEYERDTDAEKVYQWKKAKLYKKLPFPSPLDITLPF